MQFLRIPCSNFHLIKTYLQVVGCPIENCCEYLEKILNDNKIIGRFLHFLHTETHHIFYVNIIIKDIKSISILLLLNQYRKFFKQYNLNSKIEHINCIHIKWNTLPLLDHTYSIFLHHNMSYSR